MAGRLGNRVGDGFRTAGGAMTFIKVSKEPREESERSRTIYLNPDNIVAITPMSGGGSSISCLGDVHYYVLESWSDIASQLQS